MVVSSFNFEWTFQRFLFFSFEQGLLTNGKRVDQFCVCPQGY